MSDARHYDLILDQFTRQATPFNTASVLADQQALTMIVQAGRAGPNDTVLDVACGGGIIGCAFAPHVRHVTGIDMTPAMLDRARRLSADRQLANVTWQQGDVTSLPFADGSFSILVTRYSFHHLLEPLRVLREMLRVCRPGGRLVVVDMYASEDPAKAAEWNRLERLRDPSHVRCLSLTELESLFLVAGLGHPERAFYEIRDSVKNLLSRSFPNPGDETKIIEMFRASASDGRLGVESSVDGSELRYAYPTVILSAIRP
jgi:ubiquinone/menaquinone biosynthesis C-methylase UbiE